MLFDHTEELLSQITEKVNACSDRKIECTVHGGMQFTTSLNIDAAQVCMYVFMETVLPNGTGLFQHDNTPCHTRKV